MNKIILISYSVWTAIFILAGNAFPQTAEQNTYARHVKSGFENLKAKDYKSAQDSFEQALRHYDSDIAGHLGLGIAYFHLREDRLSERELLRAIELDPNESTTYQVIGELYYRKDELDSAVANWEKAAALNPLDTNLRARLERIRKEHKTEKDFNRDVTSHFLTKYEGREKIETGKIVLRILEDAYGMIGRGLSFYPSEEMQVILYSDRQFREVTDAPGWSGGIYDGKIRIPIAGIEQETPGLRRLLYHEYTHAVVHAITRRCPTWLNEGLAQHFDGREINSAMREALGQAARAGKLPSLSSLEGSFMGLAGSQAGHAYLFSLSAVKYMIDDFGMYRLKMALEELASGADAGKAIGNALLVSYEEFERGWKRSLE